MKILFLTPPLKAWDSHGHHLAPNQMHAQLAAYVRVKELGEPFVIDTRASELDWDGMMAKVSGSRRVTVVPCPTTVSMETDPFNFSMF